MRQTPRAESHVEPAWQWRALHVCVLIFYTFWVFVVIVYFYLLINTCLFLDPRGHPGLPHFNVHVRKDKAARVGLLLAHPLVSSSFFFQGSRHESHSWAGRSIENGVLSGLFSLRGPRVCPFLPIIYSGKSYYGSCSLIISRMHDLLACPRHDVAFNWWACQIDAVNDIFIYHILINEVI